MGQVKGSHGLAWEQIATKLEARSCSQLPAIMLPDLWLTIQDSSTHAKRRIPLPRTTRRKPGPQDAQLWSSPSLQSSMVSPFIAGRERLVGRPCFHWLMITPSFSTLDAEASPFFSFNSPHPPLRMPIFVLCFLYHLQIEGRDISIVSCGSLLIRPVGCLSLKMGMQKSLVSPSPLPLRSVKMAPRGSDSPSKAQNTPVLRNGRTHLTAGDVKPKKRRKPNTRLYSSPRTPRTENREPRFQASGSWILTARSCSGAVLRLRHLSD